MYLYVPAPPRLGEIIGTDARQLIRDTGKAPHRWICSLDLMFPFRGTPQLNKGTGFLISPRHVLTAGHNIFPAPGVEALSIAVTPGRGGTNFLNKPVAPVGSMTLTPGAWWVPDVYKKTADPAWDVALLTLPREFPPAKGMTNGHWADARYVPRTTITTVDRAGAVGTPVVLAGYPADKCEQDGCVPCSGTVKDYDTVRGKHTWASMQWEATGVVQPDPPPGLLFYDADTCVGMSGGPVWTQTGAGDVTLVAIHTGVHTRPNPSTGTPERLSRGVALSADRLSLLRQRLQGDGVSPTF